MRALDWLARLVLLVVSAMATLALVGSLASVSNTSLGDAFPGRIASEIDAPRDFGTRESLQPSRADVDDVARSRSPVTTDVDAAADPRPHDKPELARWLKALTYAVLALAGFAAAALVALLRIAHHLRRIADR